MGRGGSGSGRQLGFNRIQIGWMVSELNSLAPLAQTPLTNLYSQACFINMLLMYMITQAHSSKQRDLLIAIRLQEEVDQREDFSKATVLLWSESDLLLQ